MRTRVTGSIIFILTLIAFFLSFLAYPNLPAQVAVHWNLSGMADGYAPTWSLFLSAMLVAFVYILWYFIPKLEPLQKNLQKFEDSYNGFFLVLAAFCFYLHLLVIGANYGWDFDMRQAIAPAFALLFGGTGVLCSHSRRNYFMGIRTPWTLVSDKVWRKTNELGALLFYCSAVLVLLGIFHPEELAFFLLVPLFATILIVFAYSYFEFKRVKG